MRCSSLIVVTTLAACAGSQYASAPDGGTGGGSDSAPPPRTIQIASPTIDLAPMSEITFCYYFRTSNSSELAIKRWTSQLSDGVEQIVMFTTTSDQQPPGTLSTAQCGMRNSSIGPNGPVWTYSADTPTAEVDLPSDDGTGQPVGQMIQANQPGFLQLQLANPTGQVIHAQAVLTAEAYDDGVQVTMAAPFITYNTQIDLAAAPSPTAPTTDTVSGSCNVGKIAPDAKFFLMSTHTFKQSTHTFVKDGDLVTGTSVLDSAAGASPVQRLWATTPFYSFATGQLSYQCEYSNPNDYRIQTGDDEATDEICVALGYFFPADTTIGHFCLDSNLVY